MMRPSVTKTLTPSCRENLCNWFACLRALQSVASFEHATDYYLEVRGTVGARFPLIEQRTCLLLQRTSTPTKLLRLNASYSETLFETIISQVYRSDNK